MPNRLPLQHVAFSTWPVVVLLSVVLLFTCFACLVRCRLRRRRRHRAKSGFAYGLDLVTQSQPASSQQQQQQQPSLPAPLLLLPPPVGSDGRASASRRWPTRLASWTGRLLSKGRREGAVDARRTTAPGYGGTVGGDPFRGAGGRMTTLLETVPLNDGGSGGGGQRSRFVENANYVGAASLSYQTTGECCHSRQR